MIINPHRFAVAGQSYISLLHFDGTNASGTFTDQSGKIWTRANSGAYISTTESVFGGASGRFDGASGVISTPDHADWNFGSAAFTLEGRSRFLSVAGGSEYGIMSKQNAGGVSPFTIYKGGTTLYLYMSSNGTTWDIANAQVFGTVTADTWYGWAVSRVGTSIYMLFGGTLVNTITSSAALYVNTNNVEIGRDGTLYLNGYNDEFRAMKGTGLYTGSYTLATSAFPD